MAYNHTERELGRIAGALEGIDTRLDRVQTTLNDHIRDEESRLQSIENQLSLAKFLFLLLKATILTVVFVLAFKFGDVKELWRALK